MSKHIRKVLGLLQHRKQIPPPHQQPTSRTPEEWSTYWKAQGQPWRTEPQIDKKRQEYLAKRRLITPNIEQGIYPFKGVKLSRADVEWLLATHENGRGPVDWSDEKQRNRTGLDMRGADLRQVDLCHLPLACLSGGEYIRYEWLPKTYELHSDAGVNMEGANLIEAHLQGANLVHAHLERVNLHRAHLEEADLRLINLEAAQLRWAHLEGTNCYRAHLEAADLRGSFMSSTTKLREIILGNEQLGFVSLTCEHWDDVDLFVVDWSQVKILGDEQLARQKKHSDEEVKEVRFQRAVRANLQLAVILRDQGLTDEADHFAYRTQLLRRVVRRYQRKWLKYIFSWFLDLLAGYGYRPLRSLFWYLIIILGFALAYYSFGHLSLWPPDAFVYSLTSFHGRGFFPGLEGKHSLHDPLIMLAAFEAVVGLFIEISFIATFTQRFFGK